jgi:hypothetical protein
MKIGDVSRRRRFADPARQRWYAQYRCLRFSRRMMQGPPVATVEARRPVAAQSA